MIGSIHVAGQVLELKRLAREIEHLAKDPGRNSAGMAGLWQDVAKLAMRGAIASVEEGGGIVPAGVLQ